MKVKELKEMTRQQLCDYCRANKIKGYSGKTKQQRIDLILEHRGNVLVEKGFTEQDKSKLVEQQVKKIIYNLKNKRYKEIVVFDDSVLKTYKCNACGKIDFASKFAIIGNKRILCKFCESKINKLQYKYLWDTKPTTTKKPKITKQEAFRIREEMITILFHDLFYDTKMFAESLKISVPEAYKHAKWLENKDLIFGQSYDETGVSIDRGKARIYSILWEPKYCEENEDSLDLYIKELKKAMNIKQSINL